MYPTFGACFVPVSGAKTYQLGDIKVENIAPDGDFIQLIDGNDLGLLNGMYAYLSAEYAGEQTELIGWYDILNGSVGDPDYKCDDAPVNVGQAFLGYIESYSDVKLTFAGEAPTVETSFRTDGAMYPYIANYIPREIPLNWIVPKGIQPDGDFLQSIDGNDLGLLNGMYAYLGAEFVGEQLELVGWYDILNGSVGDPDYKLDDSVTVKPGEAFLGYIESLSDIEICLPSSTKAFDK